MKIKRINLFFPLVLAILLVSCTLENYIKTKEPMLSKVYHDGFLSTEYVYNDENQLKKIMYYDTTGAETSRYEFEFNADGQPYLMNYIVPVKGKTAYNEYTFNTNDQVIRADYYYKVQSSGEFVLSGSNEYEYTLVKQCTKTTSLDKDNQVKYYYVNQYSGMNTTKRLFYTPANSLVGYLEYEFDSKKVPYVPGPDYGFSVNNIIYVSSPDMDDQGVIVFVITPSLKLRFYSQTIVYEYDSQNYPSKQTINYLDGRQSVYEFEYVEQK